MPIWLIWRMSWTMRPCSSELISQSCHTCLPFFKPKIKYNQIRFVHMETLNSSLSSNFVAPILSQSNPDRWRACASSRRRRVQCWPRSKNNPESAMWMPIFQPISVGLVLRTLLAKLLIHLPMEKTSTQLKKQNFNTIKKHIFESLNRGSSLAGHAPYIWICG